uniref:Uncharacterized protein n=1 Tax=Opuntia streptacantha TaxID=393608 RepID=A0A7C9EU47_OPUST
MKATPTPNTGRDLSLLASKFFKALSCISCINCKATREEGPPEKATRTLSEGEIMPLEVTASLNFPKRDPRKHSAQKRPSSPPPAPPATAGLALHLTQRLPLIEPLVVVRGFWSSTSSSYL